jgi:hypothetical protein
MTEGYIFLSKYIKVPANNIKVELYVAESQFLNEQSHDIPFLHLPNFSLISSGGTCGHVSLIGLHADGNCGKYLERPGKRHTTSSSYVHFENSEKTTHKMAQILHTL